MNILESIGEFNDPITLTEKSSPIQTESIKSTATEINLTNNIEVQKKLLILCHKMLTKSTETRLQILVPSIVLTIVTEKQMANQIGKDPLQKLACIGALRGPTTYAQCYHGH